MPKEKNTLKVKKQSKYYYEVDRNMSSTDQYHGNTRSGGIMSDGRVPKYYKGKNGYEARKVCDNFDLTYHLATATTYILRAYRKHKNPTECITKAIAHLQFELEKIKMDEEK